MFASGKRLRVPMINHRVAPIGDKIIVRANDIRGRTDNDRIRRNMLALRNQAMCADDAVLTDDGAVFFEGNVAAYRTPRRMFIAPAATREFLKEFRGEGSPVPP